MNNKGSSKKFYIVFSITFSIIILVAPYIINELYKEENGYETIWGAKEMLAYVATVISAAGTIFIGFIAISQSEKANMISDRLLKIEEINSVPCLSIDNFQSGFVEFGEDTIHLKLFVKNITKGIIDIKDVSNIEFHMLQSDRNEILHFAKGCLNFPTLLPNQDKQLDFCANAHEDKSSNHDFIEESKYKLNLVGNVDITLNYSGSKQIYCETAKICCDVNLSLTNTISLSENGGKLTRSDYIIKRTENV